MFPAVPVFTPVGGAGRPIQVAKLAGVAGGLAGFQPATPRREFEVDLLRRTVPVQSEGGELGGVKPLQPSEPGLPVEDGDGPPFTPLATRLLK